MENLESIIYVLVFCTSGLISLILGLVWLIRLFQDADRFTQARKYHQAQKWDDAIQLYSRIILAQDEDMTHALSLHYRGTIYQTQGDFEKALADYDESIYCLNRVLPGRPIAFGMLFYFTRSRLLCQLGRWEEAWSDLEFVIGLLLPQYQVVVLPHDIPSELAIRADYAVALFACGKIDEAQAQWRELQTQAPLLTSAERAGQEFFWTDEMIAKAKELEASLQSVD